MPFGESLALIAALLLALYGCAHLIRRLCLWAVRCPKCVAYWRLAVPHSRTMLAPLLRCLQARAAWEDSGDCERTVVLLPPMNEVQRAAIEPLLREAPSVIPMTLEELTAMLTAEEGL